MERELIKMKKEYEFVIIGAGVTGLAAAMYGARLGLKTLVLGKNYGSEMPIGGVITTTDVVENYPGFIKLTGNELAENIRKHAQSYDLVEIKKEEVKDIKKNKNCFIIKTSKDEYSGKTILFATGTKWKKLPESIIGTKKFDGRGINYCALCDAPLYKNKIVCIVGGSDSAAKDALVLAQHAKKVYIIYRGEQIHPEPINLERINSKKNIEIVNKANIVEIRGENVVQSIILDRENREIKLEGIFVAIGHDILSELAITLGVKVNNKKEIIIDHKTFETNLAGVFAAGDVADKPFKQAITGVAEGCTAAYSAYEYITKNQVESC
jgi:thioredoxin reductase (NADPH)